MYLTVLFKELSIEMALKRFQVDIRTKTISNLLPLNGQFGVVPNQYFFLLSLIVQIP